MVNDGYLFFLNCFWWTRGPFLVFILLCCSSEDSLQWSTIPDGSPSKDWQSTVGWGVCRIRTGHCRFTVCCRYQWATTTGWWISWHCFKAIKMDFSVCRTSEVQLMSWLFWLSWRWTEHTLNFHFTFETVYRHLCNVPPSVGNPAVQRLTRLGVPFENTTSGYQTERAEGGTN